MPAIHQTKLLPLDENRNDPWDGDKARHDAAVYASSDGSGDKDKIDWEKYARFFFWRASLDASDFGDFKLPFAHLDDGEPTANWKGVHTCAGVIQGSMGGADVPNGDVPALKREIGRYYDLAAKEYEDDSIKVPWGARSLFAAHPDVVEFERRYGVLGGVEQRVVPLHAMELRDTGEGGFSVTGYGSVFDSRSLDLGGFEEEIAPGAFDVVLSRNPDVHLLWDHDTRWVLARTRNNTLKLQSNEIGLNYWGRVAPTSYAADLRVLLERGDIDQASFAFIVGDQEWEIREGPDGQEQVLRRILSVAELFDVTITATGAYPSASSSVARAMVRSYAGFEVPDLSELRSKVEEGEADLEPVVEETVARSNRLALAQARARARARA